jgi:peptidoglycan hydrolase CwlO-like protein
MLSELAAKLAQDPFAKVKQLIQQLIERLLHESTQEATKKGFCDMEVTKSENTRDYRFNDVRSLSSELGSLEAKKVTLEEEIVQLQDEASVLHEDLNTTSQLRAEEKEQNLATIKTAKEGLNAVKEAISILKVFYNSAASASLVQASPVDEDTSGPGFAGSYSGQQDSSKGIIAILEVVASDFDRTARLTTESEKKAAADFVEHHRTALKDIASKERQTEIDKEELQSTENTLVQKMSDLEAAQSLLDSAIQTLEDLKPMCIDTGMSYAERVEKREEEIAALKEALTFLEPAA